MRTRRGPRSVRMTVAVAGALGIIGLAGCAGGAPDRAGGPSPGGASTAAQSPLQLVRASYDATVQANTVRFTMDITASGVHTHGQGVMKFRPQELEMTMQEPQSDSTIQMRMVDRRLYFKMPKGGAATLPGGKDWLVLDLTKPSSGPLAKLMAQVSGQSPAESLGYLEGIKSVTPQGEVTIRGARATHYRVVVDLKKLASGNKLMKVAAQRMRQATGKDTFASNVWLDAQDRVVRQRFTMPMTNPSTGAQRSVGMQMDMYGFGSPVQVRPPPKRQTVDIARLMSPSGRA